MITKKFMVYNKPAVVMYIEGIVDGIVLADFVLKPCQAMAFSQYTDTIDIIDHVSHNLLSIPKLEISTDTTTLVEDITKGKGILLIDGSMKYISLDLEKVMQRALTEPPTSAVAKGPRVGFVEDIKTNTSCIRKILSTDKLKVESVQVGRYTATSISVLYLDGIADRNIVNKVLNKLKNIDIDGIIDSYYIVSFLEEHKYSIFREVGQTEKPDILCAKMLEGRIAILVDGSPIALTIPFMLFEDIQSSNDYYSDNNHTSFVRMLRLISILMTITLPGIYIAIQLHHYKAFPLKFLITIINSTQNLPLTPFLEMLFILVLFEILYEASLRMPKYMGIAMSIVGALILGDTAVKAGLVSPPAVMIVAVSGITLYTVPEQSDQISVLRFVFTIVGGILGIFGMVLFGLYLLVYLNDFDSYGVSYLSPYTPYMEEDTKDGVFQRDLLSMHYRPRSLNNKNKTRLRK
jgi:spore germination protein KA